ncbi:MAG: SDR family oxidoreductase [Myxococcota bacterium]|nr:SDR family oxidoreductase [Myxococcota bacterium]
MKNTPSRSKPDGESPVTLITGASTGIGAASALALARRGHRVWASMRDPSRGEALLEQAASDALSIHPLELDVTEGGSVEDAVACVLKESGRLDHLVANAGFHAGSSVEDTRMETFQALMETNYLGVIRCVKAVLPSMREQGSGSIVGVSSQSGRFVMPTNAAYCATKYAMEAALETLSLEVVRFGIRVVLIEPGLTFTAAMEKNVPWPEGTAYESVYRRTGAIFADEASEGSEAEPVAEVIADAVEAIDGPLRRVVGRDAERNLASRSRLEDRDFVDLHRIESDEGFLSAWRTHFGPGSREEAD